MKHKLIVVAALVALIVCAGMWLTTYARAQVSESVKFQWEQPAADLPSLKGWNLYIGDSNTGPWTLMIFVTYGGENVTTFTGTTTVSVTGAAGSTVRKYFAATAVNKDGKESTYATGQPATQEVTRDFKIPYPLPTGPFNFTIIFEITVK